MDQHQINRREFVAISAATAATTAISSSALADSISPAATKPLRIPSPSLARIIPSKNDPTKARLLPRALLTTPSPQLSNPLLTLTPLPCVDARLNQDASITIELHYPAPNLYAILYRAHNITIPNKSIPAYASSIHTNSPNASPTLKVTQHTKNASKSTLLTLAPGAHLLAIPTATHASNPNFRFTSAILDTNGNITKLANPMPAASSRCAYFSITLSDKSTGA